MQEQSEYERFIWEFDVNNLVKIPNRDDDTFKGKSKEGLKEYSLNYI